MRRLFLTLLRAIARRASDAWHSSLLGLLTGLVVAKIQQRKGKEKKEKSPWIPMFSDVLGQSRVNAYSAALRAAKFTTD